ncbi:MAG: hypothetical protein ABII12_03925 [Planctomycetota bacterium]
MSSLCIAIVLALQSGVPLAQTQPAQEDKARAKADTNNDGGQPDVQQTRPRERREGPSDEDRRRMREWRQRYSGATPEEQEELRLERWTDMTARLYELDEQQREQVHQEIAAISKERREVMGDDAQEYDRIRREMFELRAKGIDQEEGDWESRRQKWRELRESPKFRELSEKLQAFQEKYPLDMEASIQRIEKLLPEDQVAKGRERREMWRGRREERRARGDGPPGRIDREERREQRRARATREPAEPAPPRDAAAEALAKEAAKQAAEAEKAAAEARRLAEEEAARIEAARKKPLHPWEKYVRDFSDRYELTEQQDNSAMSVLKDVLTQAQRIEQTNAPKIAEAEKIKDAIARAKRLAELNATIDSLFEELKARLDSLLTAPQRAMGKAKPPSK